MQDRPAADVLPYVAPHRGHYAGVNVAVTAGAAPILAIYYDGLAPSISSLAFDYSRDIPLSEALTVVDAASRLRDRVLPRRLVR
jgi:hypothetical protein